MTNTGKRLSHLRKSKGLTQQELADILDTTPIVISNWECGRRNPKRSTLRKLAKAFARNSMEETAYLDYLLNGPSQDDGSSDDTSEMFFDIDKYPSYQAIAINTFENLLNKTGQIKVLAYIEDLLCGFRYIEKPYISVSDILNDEFFTNRSLILKEFINKTLSSEGLKKVTEYALDLSGNKYYQRPPLSKEQILKIDQ